VRGNNIEAAGGEILARALANQTTLKTFDISHNALGDRGASRFARTLVSNTTLTSLDLSHTQLGECVRLFLISWLISPTSFVIALFCDDYWIGMRTMTRMALALPANRTLLRLSLDEPIFTSVQEEATAMVAKCLRDNATLTSLSLAKHGLRDHGANWLSWSLDTNVSLSHLDLHGNQISVSGVSSLASTLVNRSLETTIILDGNPLASQLLDELDEALDRARAGPKAVARVAFTSHLTKVRDRHAYIYSTRAIN
jgi:hypothetical protein